MGNSKPYVQRDVDLLVTLWIGLDDPGPIRVSEIESSCPNSRRKFQYLRDGQLATFELPKDASRLYDKTGRYQPYWIQPDGMTFHYSWVDAVRCALAEVLIDGPSMKKGSRLYEMPSRPFVLPTSKKGLRKIIQQQHPDKNGGVEGPHFRMAQNKLLTMRRAE